MCGRFPGGVWHHSLGRAVDHTSAHFDAEEFAYLFLPSAHYTGGMDTLSSVKTSPLAEVRGMYEAFADSYSSMMDKEIDLPLYTDVLGRLAERITTIPGAVLDPSCGSGHMLEKLRDEFDAKRPLVGIDLSPSMVRIAGERLGDKAEVRAGDMRDLAGVESGATAAVVNFFAFHHLDPRGVLDALRESYRVLRSKGQLVVATWEGSGAIDYGGKSDVVALRYTKDEVAAWAKEAQFVVDRCVVEPVPDMPMDAVYLEGTKP